MQKLAPRGVNAKQNYGQVEELPDVAQASDTANLTEVYGSMEYNLLTNLYKTESLLTAALNEQRYLDATKLSQVHKDILGNYNEAVRLRKVNGVEEGRFIPAEVLEAYQKDVFPSIATAVENLRIAVLNALPDEMRPFTENAWRAAYPALVDEITAAGDRLNVYVAEVQAQALAEQKRSNPNRKRADLSANNREATAEERKAKVRKANTENKAKSRARAKAKAGK